jgi:hypothetical protein
MSDPDYYDEFGFYSPMQISRRVQKLERCCQRWSYRTNGAPRLMLRSSWAARALSSCFTGLPIGDRLV